MSLGEFRLDGLEFGHLRLDRDKRDKRGLGGGLRGSECTARGFELQLPVAQRQRESLHLRLELTQSGILVGDFPGEQR